MSTAHVAAVVARLASGPAGTLNAYDSVPTGATYPYVIVYADGGVKSSDREADIRVRTTLTWQTTTVGTSAAQCRAALDRVTAALEDWRPTLTGWTGSKVEHESAQPVRPDESLPDRVVFYATDQWSSTFDPT